MSGISLPFITETVFREVANTKTRLSQEAVTDPNDLKRLFRFSVPTHAVELSKAREIYEESIRLVHEHVQKGRELSNTKYNPTQDYVYLLTSWLPMYLMKLSCLSPTFRR